MHDNISPSNIINSTFPRWKHSKRTRHLSVTFLLLHICIVHKVPLLEKCTPDVVVLVIMFDVDGLLRKMGTAVPKSHHFQEIREKSPENVLCWLENFLETHSNFHEVQHSSCSNCTASVRCESCECWGHGSTSDSN